jgi:hypothetical protein
VCTVHCTVSTRVIPANRKKGESALYSSNWVTLEQPRKYESTDTSQAPLFNEMYCLKVDGNEKWCGSKRRQ